MLNWLAKPILKIQKSSRPHLSYNGINYDHGYSNVSFQRSNNLSISRYNFEEYWLERMEEMHFFWVFFNNKVLYLI